MPLYIPGDLFDNFNTKLQVLKKEYDQLDSLKKEIEDIHKIIDIFKSKEVIDKNTSRFNKGKNTVIHLQPSPIF